MIHIPLRAPAVLAHALEGARAKACNRIAIVQECFGTPAVSPAFGSTSIRRSPKDGSESGRSSLPIDLVENATRRPRTVGCRNSLERKLSFRFTCHDFSSLRCF